jgi:RNA-directed DNA polymerase
MADRARQTVATYVREPAGEARVAPNRAGVRPGRSGHEAITALHTAIGHQATDVLDAAIATGCERINPTA